MGWDKGQLATEGCGGKTFFLFLLLLLLPLYIVYSVLGLRIV